MFIHEATPKRSARRKCRIQLWGSCLGGQARGDGAGSTPGAQKWPLMRPGGRWEMGPSEQGGFRVELRCAGAGGGGRSLLPARQAV